MTPIQGYTRGLWALSCRSETLSNDGTIVIVFMLPLHWEPAEPAPGYNFKVCVQPTGFRQAQPSYPASRWTCYFFMIPQSLLSRKPFRIRLPRSVCNIPHSATPFRVNSVQKGRYTINTQWQLLNTIPALVEKVNCLLNAWLRHSPDKASCQAGHHGKFNLLSLQTAWFHFKE